MYKHCILALALALAAHAAGDAPRPKQTDPFTLMDSLFRDLFPPRVKVWPWFNIFEDVNPLEDPKLVSNKNKCEIDLFVKRFQPEELKVRVKNRYVIVEGRRQAADEDSHFSVNRFVQNFALPAGCKEDEVVAVYEKGVLSISAPKHELPPPPPEREIPIEVRRPIEITSTTEKKEELTTEKQELTTKEVLPLQTSSATPLDQLDLVEATTHVGKIRKKELKSVMPKKATDNEVVKGDVNGLDYALVE